MADKWAAFEMISRTGTAYDAHDLDGAMDCFTNDAVMKMSIAGGDVMQFAGADAIKALYGGSMTSQTDQRRHIITNVSFSNETDNSVDAKSILLLVAVENGALKVLSSGLYTDHIVNDGGSWRLKERFLALDLPY